MEEVEISCEYCTEQATMRCRTRYCDSLVCTDHYLHPHVGTSESVAELYAHTQAPPFLTKSEIMETHWVEFLRWVRKNHFCLMEERRKAVEAGSYIDNYSSERDPNEVNFWYWYVEHKMEDEG